MRHAERERFLVKRSRPGLGLGLFAARAFARGEYLLEYTGKKIPTAHADTLKTRYLFELDSEWTIDGSDASNTARYINHSCIPNCECEVVNGKILIYAKRDIAEGEELTFDYGEEYFDEFIRPDGCLCERCARGAGYQRELISA